MRRAARSSHFWVVLGSLAAFCAGAWFLDNRNTLILSNATLFVTSFVTSLAYAPIAWRAIRYGEGSTFQHLVVGIVLVSTGNWLWRVLSLLWLTSGQDPALVNNDVVAGLQAMISLGYLEHVTSPGALGVSVRKRGLAVAGIAVVALVFAGWMIFVPPDTRPLAQAIIPWLPR